MFLSYLTLIVALSLSAIAAWYSIVGLTAIFAAAVIPIIIMGGALEVAKITATVWLHEHWDRCRWLMRLYLVSAVIILMIITSMGIFGFLSRAHIEQSAPIGDTAAQIEIIEEKIEIEQQVIAQYRQDLEILNQQIERFNQLGAVTRGVNARATQQAERETIFGQIAQSQQTITDLRQQRAPLAADIRKIETEVGPIKYIAALIYGDNPDQDLLEKAVRWMIMLLVVVFDPLAIVLILAATQSLRWQQPVHDIPKSMPQQTEPVPVHQPNDNAPTDQSPEPAQESALQPVLEQHPHVEYSAANFVNSELTVVLSQDLSLDEDDECSEEEPHIKAAMREWKRLHPGHTAKHQRDLLAQGRIHQLPWMTMIEELPVVQSQHGFGKEFPVAASKGDSFVKIDRIPSQLFKFNGNRWIEIDKNSTDNYTYDMAYIDHLIQLISQGTYDAELLTDAEQLQVANRLQNNSETNT